MSNNKNTAKAADKTKVVAPKATTTPTLTDAQLAEQKEIQAQKEATRQAEAARLAKLEGDKVAPSEAKKRFKAMIEAYKIQNPTKYALKKEELEKKLNTL